MRKVTPRVLLCVDDDEAMRRAMSVCLEANGYMVRACANGAAALSQVAAGPFYAAVLDYSLPDMTGGELAAVLHEQSPATPIIVFSGSVGAIPASTIETVDIVLDKQQGIGELMSALDSVSSLRPFSTVRKYQRYPVQLAFSLTVTRARRTATYSGLSTTLAEGGMGGVLQGDINPGEVVSISLSDPDLTHMQPRAAVRYKHGDVYGFEFLSLSASQRQVIRDSCERWQAFSQTSL